MTVGGAPVKDGKGNDIDLNSSLVYSPSEEIALPVAFHSGASTTATRSPNHPGMHPMTATQTRQQSGDRLHRKYTPSKFHRHREDALRLRGKPVRSLSKDERLELSKTRKYLGLKIKYHERTGHDQAMLDEAKDLWGHLQGGHWVNYTAPLGEDDLRRQKIAQKSVRFRRKKKLMLETGSASSILAHNGSK